MRHVNSEEEMGLQVAQYMRLNHPDIAAEMTSVQDVRHRTLIPDVFLEEPTPKPVKENVNE